MKNLILLILFIVSTTIVIGQDKGHGATDTLLLNSFDSLPGNAITLSYTYSNGSGFFFGTNFLDIDQDPNTPYENGAQGIAQGFKLGPNESYYVLEVLVRVGIKIKNSTTGTPLIISVHLLDDSTTYNVTSGGVSTPYTIASPGTTLGSSAIQWDDILSGAGVHYSIAHFNTPLFVDQNFTVTVDFADLYWNNDRVGLYASPHGGASNIYGREFTLWHYPNPDLWVQVTHIFSSVNRAIALFPVVDNGTYGIESPNYYNGLKLGQAFPNPAEYDITFPYALENKTNVSMEIISSNGQLVRRIEKEDQAKGEHSIKIDVSNYTAGIYYYTLFTDNGNLTKKFIVK